MSRVAVVCPRGSVCPHPRAQGGQRHSGALGGCSSSWIALPFFPPSSFFSLFPIFLFFNPLFFFLIPFTFFFPLYFFFLLFLFSLPLFFFQFPPHFFFFFTTPIFFSLFPPFFFQFLPFSFFVSLPLGKQAQPILPLPTFPAQL